MRTAYALIIAGIVIIILGTFSGIKVIETFAYEPSGQRSYLIFENSVRPEILLKNLLLSIVELAAGLVCLWFGIRLSLERNL